MKICPNPIPWHQVHKRLSAYAQSHQCRPPTPPKPLILAGWAYSNDLEKEQRWEETVAWAADNGCPELVEVADGDFYFTDEPTSYEIGPVGGPMFRPWDFEEKEFPHSEMLAELLEMLKSRWNEIVGSELGRITKPLAFSGTKGRRLLVHAERGTRPPWGGWAHRSEVEAERRTFTRFRAEINNAIAPHEIDHIEFVTDEDAGERILGVG